MLIANHGSNEDRPDPYRKGKGVYLDLHDFTEVTLHGGPFHAEVLTVDLVKSRHVAGGIILVRKNSDSEPEIYLARPDDDSCLDWMPKPRLTPRMVEWERRTGLDFIDVLTRPELEQHSIERPEQPAFLDGELP